MNLSALRQKIFSLAAKIGFRVYNVVVIGTVILVMIWHRAWKLEPRVKNAPR